MTDDQPLKQEIYKNNYIFLCWWTLGYKNLLPNSLILEKMQAPWYTKMATLRDRLIILISEIERILGAVQNPRDAWKVSQQHSREASGVSSPPKATLLSLTVGSLWIQPLNFTGMD